MISGDRASRARKLKDIVGDPVSSQNSFYFIKRLLSYSLQNKWALALGLMSMLLITIMTVSFGQAVRFVIDGMPEDISKSTIYANYILAVTLIIIGVYFLASFFRMYCMRLVSIGVAEELRKDVFANVIDLGANYLDSHSTGAIQTRIINDTTSLGNFLAKQIPTFIKSILMLIAALAACFYVNSKLALIVMIGVPLVVCPTIIISRSLRKVAAKWQAAIAEAGRFVGEVFRNIKIVHAFNRNVTEVKCFSKKVEYVSDLDKRVNRLQLLLNSLVETLSFVFFAFLFWFAAMDILSGRISTGELVSFGFYVQAIIISARNLVDVGSSFNIAAGIASKIIEYLDAKNPLKPQTKNAKSLPLPLNGKIEFRNICFSYPSRPTVQVLNGINLTIKPNKSIAIVGPSGAGKSTLIELIMRIYEPSSGYILVDDIDLRKIEAKNLCENVGFMPQKSLLVTGSVLENICFGSSEVDFEKVLQVSKLAHAHDFIEKLPHGYHTDLGETGRLLSGGQQQRISLARALFKVPKFLFLDEPTSSLDQESEREIEAALDQIRKKNTTVIMITHKIENAMKADSIAVLDNGKVVAQGTHMELIVKSKLYRRLASQSNEEALASAHP